MTLGTLKRDQQSSSMICASPSIREEAGTAPFAGVAGSISAPYKVAQCSSTKNLDILQHYLLWLISVPHDPLSDPGAEEVFQFV